VDLPQNLPLPGTGDAAVAVAAPGEGPGWWAGASSVVRDGTGFAAGYRLRNGHDGNDQTVVARSDDGVTFETVAVLDQSQFGAQWMERPALVALPGGGWRLYTCCGTPESKGWWIDVLEAPTLEGLGTAEARTVFPGDELTAVKDPVVRLVDGGWHAWICCHHLDVPGEEDRMSTAYASSADGLEWTWHGTVLSGRPGAWDARGARLTTLLPGGWVAYDGRRNAAENWFERCGLARTDGGTPTRYEALDREPVADLRYLDAVTLDDGAVRLYYEHRLPDESHELRTEYVPAR
jgi:hypothetical protein